MKSQVEWEHVYMGNGRTVDLLKMWDVIKWTVLNSKKKKDIKLVIEVSCVLATRAWEGNRGQKWILTGNCCAKYPVRY